MNSPTIYVPPPLIPSQVERISRHRQGVRLARNAFFIQIIAFLVAPLFLPLHLRQYAWVLGVLCAVISGLTSYRKWMLEHKRYKIVVGEELLSRILDRKLPLHTYSAARQLSRDWLRISHFVHDENAHFGPADENLLYKVFSQGNLEIFHQNLVSDFALWPMNFRGAMGTYTGKSRLGQHDMVVTFGKNAKKAPTFDVPRASRILNFRHRMTGEVTDQDPDYKLLRDIEELNNEISQVVDLKWLRVVIEGRFMLIALWSDDIFFDLPTDIKIDSAEMYPYFRRYVRVYTLLARFLQKNFVPTKEQSEIHWY